jgi:putative SOS response-associated peptidase YedK
MCGRFVLATSTDDLQREFEIEHLVNPMPAPSWNVAPTDPVAMVTERRASGGPTAAEGSVGTAGVRELRTARWGLVPHWATDRSIGPKMINARSETVASKPAFRAAAARRRCLVPANGYYEWSGSGSAKTPFYLHDADDAVLAMAGLYEIWRDPELPEDHPDRLLWTVTVITRAAPDSLGHIHDRSPVAVPRDLRSDWLDCWQPDGPSATELLAAIPPPRLVPREVGRAVGNVRNNDPSLIEPAEVVPDALF